MLRNRNSFKNKTTSWKATRSGDEDQDPNKKPDNFDNKSGHENEWLNNNNSELTDNAISNPVIDEKKIIDILENAQFKKKAPRATDNNVNEISERSTNSLNEPVNQIELNDIIANQQNQIAEFTETVANQQNQIAELLETIANQQFKIFKLNRMIQQDHIIGHLELPRVPEQLVAGADIISNNAIEVLNYSLIYKNTINEILASSDNVITNPNQEQLIQGIVQQLADQEQLIQNIFYKQNLLYKILMYNPTINDVIEQEEEELVADLPVQNVDNNIDSISGYFIDIFNYLSNSLGGPMQVAIVSIVTLFLIGYIFKVFVNSYSVTLEGPLTNSGSIIRRAEALWQNTQVLRLLKIGWEYIKRFTIKIFTKK